LDVIGSLSLNMPPLFFFPFIRIYINGFAGSIHLTLSFRFFALNLDRCLIAVTALLIYSWAEGDFSPRSAKNSAAIDRSDIS
jgi:hypothetical protein